jgi:Ner family transcriptional regulator
MAPVKQNPTSGVDWDAIDVIAAVHRVGTSIRQIAFAHGLSESAVRVALRRSAPRSEKLIAEVLNLPVSAIWPERESIRETRRSRKILNSPDRERV